MSLTITAPVLPVLNALPLITVPNKVLPSYMIETYLDNDKHDRHYAQMLEFNLFHEYVMDYDGVQSQVHAPTAEEIPNLYCALVAQDISDIFENLHNERPENRVEEFLLSIAVQDGFVILMDDRIFILITLG